MDIRTNPRIVFLVMSAVAKSELIDQLAFALAPHVVLVHHDFSQTPEFRLTAPNVVLVPEPKRTGWGVFGFVDGIFHSMQFALANLEFDYLEVLSPTCLPIKPLRQFEAHVSGPAEAHFDCIDLLSDRDALMSVGYRAFTPEKSLRHRVLRRLSRAYFPASPGRRDEAGIWLHSGGGRSLVSGLALASMKAFSWPSIGRHIFGEEFRPYYGSAWFGAKRNVIARMVDAFPGVRPYFSRLCLAEEFIIPTLLMHLGPGKGPMNHLIQTFNEAHVGEISEEDAERISTSTAYFARKFPASPEAPIRSWVLRELVGVDPMPHLAARALTSSFGGPHLVPAPVTCQFPGNISNEGSAVAGALWGRGRPVT